MMSLQRSELTKRHAALTWGHERRSSPCPYGIRDSGPLVLRCPRAPQFRLHTAGPAEKSGRWRHLAFLAGPTTLCPHRNVTEHERRLGRWHPCEMSSALHPSVTPEHSES